MRFIRDIIAEKQANRASGSSARSGEARATEADFEIDDFEMALEENGIARREKLKTQVAAETEAFDDEPDLELSEDDDSIENEAEAMPSIDFATLEMDASPELEAIPEPEPEQRLRAAVSATMDPGRPPLDTADPDPRLSDRENSQSSAAEMAVPEQAEHEAEPAPVAESPVVLSSTPVRETSEEMVEVPRPAAGRSAARSGRVKTRLLGFGAPQQNNADPFQKTAQGVASAQSTFPVGWLIVVEGPGRGAAFSLYNGVAQIGRSPDQAVPLEFGDNSISRENHAAIAYDDEQKAFFLGHGGKANLVRLNGRPVLSTEEIRSEDTIRIGETTLRFIALCGAQFSWSQNDENGTDHVAAE